MRKKTIAVALLCTAMTLLSCKKEKTADPVENPIVTPVTPVFGDGFKVEDNLGQITIADSSKAFTTSGSDQFIIESYRGEFTNVELAFKQDAMVTAKTYPLDSLDKDRTIIMYGIWGYEIKSGSVVISSISSTKVSGTFVFEVQQEVGTSSRTQVKGTFNNVKVK